MKIIQVPHRCTLFELVLSLFWKTVFSFFLIQFEDVTFFLILHFDLLTVFLLAFTLKEFNDPSFIYKFYDIGVPSPRFQVLKSFHAGTTYKIKLPTTLTPENLKVRPEKAVWSRSTYEDVGGNNYVLLKFNSICEEVTLFARDTAGDLVPTSDSAINFQPTTFKILPRIPLSTHLKYISRAIGATP